MCRRVAYKILAWTLYCCIAHFRSSHSSTREAFQRRSKKNPRIIFTNFDIRKYSYLLACFIYVLNSMLTVYTCVSIKIYNY